MAKAFRDNTSLVTAELTNSKNDSPIIGATVTATLRDKDDVIVTGANALPMTETSDGTYCVELPNTLTLPDKQYFLTIDGTEITGEVIKTVITVNIKDRRS